jgi:hypothetical protein
LQVPINNRGTVLTHGRSVAPSQSGEPSSDPTISVRNLEPKRVGRDIDHGGHSGALAPPSMREAAAEDCQLAPRTIKGWTRHSARSAAARVTGRGHASMEHLALPPGNSPKKAKGRRGLMRRPALKPGGTDPARSRAMVMAQAKGRRRPPTKGTDSPVQLPQRRVGCSSLLYPDGLAAVLREDARRGRRRDRRHRRRRQR